MDFDKLVDVYEELEKTSSGNQMREILSDFFKTVPKDDIALVSYLTLGQISSEFESAVLGLAEKTVLKAIASAGAISIKKVKEIMHSKGDVGLTAEKVLQKKPQTLIPIGKLTIHDLFDTLHKIVKLSGTGSQDKKTQLLVSVLQKASSKGAKYLSRIVLGTLRMGAGDMTVIDSLAIAFTGEKKNKEHLERAYNICPDVGVIAETLARDGLKGLEKIQVHVSRPIKMMLAQRVKEWEEVVKKIPGTLAAEGKYDGERVQAHKTKSGEIMLFSRRLENITDQFPDLVEYIQKQINAKEFIIEAEILAIDKEGKHLPFQTLMQRRRKYDIEEYIKKIPVQAKIFELLYLDGKSYLNESYKERIKQIEKIVKKGKHLTTADRIITDDVEELKKFFSEMLDDKQEGIMIKSLEGVYQAGTRGWNWIKWKKDYSQDMIDTFDLVVIGAFYGRGKRHGTYGALLCATYNTKNDTFETICKLGTGLTDEMLASLPGKLDGDKVKIKPARVIAKKEMEPDVWFTPTIIVEVLAAEITKSPFHSCASGLALRFPRFLHFRDDKKAEQATTSEEVKDMFEK
ncbi:ATP-dependent DNA ligase [Candidatus Woesearchaeota archaeon]|jgi:DNA ligase 1|nr:ATP-dependent DNA ligase [Candidatus Woesearchaeota archaeon]MBT5396633.1 ATP-dependent DNA ligase [Candidatus Woesearchaeota archaeon]MBT5924906.1 ATP-dependent DNA ligase [Candidatus Woesearchaeota archaeon]MBT6367580.1 ATP-dependent DNA ligase [Candidatus Woesearchaeota archaeon]MBT7763079.1 ATP-dependent DNA ligase [Candidatus Woesearchaeota archaeon]